MNPVSFGIQASTWEFISNLGLQVTLKIILFNFNPSLPGAPRKLFFFFSNYVKSFNPFRDVPFCIFTECQFVKGEPLLICIFTEWLVHYRGPYFCTLNTQMSFKEFCRLISRIIRVLPCTQKGTSGRYHTCLLDLRAVLQYCRIKHFFEGGYLGIPC